MRIQLGILVCLLAGCVTQPTTSSPKIAAVSPRAAREAAGGNRPCNTQVLRIGIEDLPPDENAPPNEPPRAVPQHPIAAIAVRWQGHGEEAARADASSTAWRTDYASIEDPLAREAVHFVDDLVAADRHRVRREVGLPFFDAVHNDEHGPLLVGEQALETERQQWLQDHGSVLLRRPVQQLLRRLPIAHELDVALEDFRDNHLVLDEDQDRRPLARISVRVRANDLHDPVEVATIVGGLRVATSQKVGKVSLDFDLSPTIDLELRAETTYADRSYQLRADLSLHPSACTSYHVAIGDQMDFLTTSSLYSLFESPMDGSPGLVLYAAHIF